MSSSTEAPYLLIARRKQEARAAQIPAKWNIPSSLVPRDPPRLEDGAQNVLSVPSQILSPNEVSITESYSICTLLSAIASKKLSATAVAEAFCHRAAIAHQLTNCLTEPLFESAITRSKELDHYLNDTGKLFGPLHGLPVSVKDTFGIKGVDNSAGMAALCFKPAQANAPLVDMLLSLGCVIIAKTNVPQTLASLDSVNHVFGRTMNPINRLCTAGGSSGGEGVLVAMRGSMIGIGTDVGGSIRVPAMCNGIYGFKPSNGRFPYSGQAVVDAKGIARTSVQATAGPIARSMEDLECFLKEVMPVANMWGEDCMPCSWAQETFTGCGHNGELVIGILRGDGNCALLPPIDKLMTEVAHQLKSAPKLRVIELPTPKAWTRCQSLMSKLMGVEGGQTMAALLEETKEPLVPWMQSRFRSGKPRSLPEVAELQARRAVLEREMLRVWTTQDQQGRRRWKTDAIICPLAAHPVPPIEGYNAVGYTSSWVLLDYPAASMPVRDFTEQDLELGKPFGGKPLSSWDERNRDLWDESKINRKVYLGTPLSIQVVTPRLEDQKLVKVMHIIDQAIRTGNNASSKPNL